MKRKQVLGFFLCSVLFSAIQVLAQKVESASQKSKSNSVSKSNISPNDILGEVLVNGYRNEFFGIKISSPLNWFNRGISAGDEIQKNSYQKLKGVNSQAQKALHAARQTEIIHFVTSKNISVVSANTRMLFGTIKLNSSMRIKSGKEYLAMTIKTLKQVTLPPAASYSETVEMEKLGNQEFYFIDIDGLDPNNPFLRQRIYQITKKGYVLFFTLSWMNDKDLQTLKAMLETSDFDWKP